ncbi:MAG TPA: CocE/NonD family hydrolase [Steroidobacteraceae bacterium]
MTEDVQGGVRDARRWIRLASALWLLVCTSVSWLPSTAIAQEFEFRAPASAADPGLPAAVRDLATRVLPVYQEPDSERYLNNLSALQMVSGDPTSAYASRQSLRDRRRSKDAGRPVARALLYDMYIRARAAERSDKVPLAQALTQSFRDTVPKLGDLDAFVLSGWLKAPVAAEQESLQRVLDQVRARSKLNLSQALEVIWAWLTLDTYRGLAGVAGPLDAEDEARRYVYDNEVLIKTADNVTLSAIVVRPRDMPKPLPALLEFTNKVDPENRARECAAHGYVGVIGYTRGKYKSTDAIIPYQHEGDDARAVISWIAQQSWSDGRVGMYGVGYGAFTQWAAAKRLPGALKAIATTGTMVPGIDTPMEGGIFHNSSYRWALAMVGGPGSEEAAAADDAHWRALDTNWYTSGKPYRDLDRLNGVQNRFFRRWLNHPSYDRFWQSLVPYGKELGHLNIPVLAMTGYFDPSAAGTLYFFNQLARYNPRANQTLLVGPYDENTLQHEITPALRNYPLDPVALLDLNELRYQWFDSVFKGGKRPELLARGVNFEVMGANQWRHAASLEAMARGSAKFYFEAVGEGDTHHLATRRAPDAHFVKQSLNLADRSDADWRPAADLMLKSLPPHNSVTFVSDPMSRTVELDGQFTLHLDFTVNRMDMDLNFAVYELLPGGDYVRLFGPSYEIRASYAGDRVHRRLLKAGVRQKLTLHAERLTSRRVEAGNRLILILGLNKRADRQINYGTGTDVSDESVEDAKGPLKVRWYSGSYIEFPARR